MTWTRDRLKLTPSVQRVRKRRIGTFWRILLYLLLLGGFVLTSVNIVYSLSAYIYPNRESPLDHVGSSIRKVLLKPVRKCPHVDDMDYLIQSKHCQPLPPIYMYSYRSEKERLKITGNTWANVSMTIVNTKNISDTYQNLECPEEKWENRLFFTIQVVLSQLLLNHPGVSGFVLMEDDVILEDPEGFHQEMCMAHFLKLDFYSFYRTKPQGTSCTYMSGTLAFYIRRNMMRKLIAPSDMDSYCRLGIDMYISKMGPWFATRKLLVSHNGNRTGKPTPIVHRTPTIFHRMYRKLLGWKGSIVKTTKRIVRRE